MSEIIDKFINILSRTTSFSNKGCKSKIKDLETKLGVRLPVNYVDFISKCSSCEIDFWFSYNVDEIISTAVEMEAMMKDYEKESENDFSETYIGTVMMNDIQGIIVEEKLENDLNQEPQIEEQILEPETHIGPVKPMYWNRKWIPIFVCDGDILCLDFDPLEGGNEGQVILWALSGDYLIVKYESFDEFVVTILKAYDDGDYSLEETEFEGNRYVRMAYNKENNLHFYGG